MQRVFVQQKPQQVDIVHGLVQSDAGAGIVEPPVAQVFGQPAGIAQGDGADCTDPARYDVVAHRPVHCAMSQMMVHRQNTSGLVSGRDHSPGVVEFRSDRLFAEHVTARTQGLQGLGAMFVIDAGNIDRVCALYRLIQTLRGQRQGEVGSKCFSTVQIG